MAYITGLMGLIVVPIQGVTKNIGHIVSLLLAWVLDLVKDSELVEVKNQKHRLPVARLCETPLFFGGWGMKL